MKDILYSSTDARQSPMWGDYLSKIGWKIEWVENIQIFIRPLPFLPFSIIKIQHPLPPIPFKKIDQIAKKNKALATILEPHNFKFAEKSFLDNGYSISKLRFAHTATTKIDLTKPEKEIFKDFSENAKRNIRKAQENLLVKNYFLKEIKNFEEVFLQFFALFSSMQKIKKIMLPGKTEQSKRLKAFAKNSFILFAYLKKSNGPIAALWIFFYKDVAYYMQTGTSELGYKLMANYLLTLEAIKQSKKLKLKVFDFEAIYDPRYKSDHKSWIKFSEFKKRFHGQIIEYPPSYIKFYNPFFKLFYLCMTYFSK
ncbi:peptidoglycan bridge formation glycyltransferase FemA/FemB family protein [Candidatus Daviesbacteria bacterium]|nr:peptidoglycan bridge formation glycyltransferase FemA/FemB family protein [Candidatus Daviesbacteria bacterium]